MVRPRRIKFSDPEQGAYHIISKALQGEYRLKDEEKQKFLSLLRWLSDVYFVRIATFSLMTTHIHMVIKMIRKEDISEAELRRRFDNYYNRYVKDDSNMRGLRPEEIPAYYERFSDISRFMQDLKQRFSRWYNTQHHGVGHVWADRFKSVLLVGNRAIRSCMLYVELNALRAGIVKEPEKYPYCGLHFLHKGGRHCTWLDQDLLQEVLQDYEMTGAQGERASNPPHIVSRYFRLVYREGLNLKGGKASIPEEIWQQKQKQFPEEVQNSIYMTKITHFTNGIILGNKEDCEKLFAEHKEHFRTTRDREAKPVIKAEESKLSILGIGELTELFSIRSVSKLLR